MSLFKKFSIIQIWITGVLFFVLGTTNLKALENVENLWSARIPISLEGTIHPIEIIREQTSVGGRIIAITVEENDEVQKNQLLLSLKNDSQKQQLEVAQLQQKINQNNLIDREQLITLAKVQLDSAINSVRDRERQVNLMMLQLKTSRNNLKDRQRQVTLAETQIGIRQNAQKDQETNLKDIERRLKDEETLFEQGSSTKSQLDAVQLQKDRGLLSLSNAKLNVLKSIQDLDGVKLAVENAEISILKADQDVEGGKLLLENAK